MGGRADQLLAQRLRPTPSLHRTPPGLRRRLPRPGRRHRHHPCTAAGRMVLIPLGHPAKITAHPLTYWRTLLALVHLSLGATPVQLAPACEALPGQRSREALLECTQQHQTYHVKLRALTDAGCSQTQAPGGPAAAA